MTTTIMAMWVYQIPQRVECPSFAQFIIPQNVKGKELVVSWYLSQNRLHERRIYFRLCPNWNYQYKNFKLTQPANKKRNNPKYCQKKKQKIEILLEKKQKKQLLLLLYKDLTYQQQWQHSSVPPNSLYLNIPPRTHTLNQQQTTEERGRTERKYFVKIVIHFMLKCSGTLLFK